MTLEEQIKFAKSLVGKKIKSRIYNKYYLINKFEIHSEIFQRTNTNNDEIIDVLKIQPAFVWLDGENGYGRVILPTSKSEDFKIIEEVKVNGYLAEDMGDYYKFGCAEISKGQLRGAKDFLSYWDKESPNSNKKIHSVKIGAGEFTLEILNKLKV